MRPLNAAPPNGCNYTHEGESISKPTGKHYLMVTTDSKTNSEPDKNTQQIKSGQTKWSHVYRTKTSGFEQARINVRVGRGLRVRVLVSTNEWMYNVLHKIEFMKCNNKSKFHWLNYHK